MRKAGGFRSDRALARFLNVPQTTLSGWRRRGSVPIKPCVDFSEAWDVNLDWLLTGKGTPDQPDRFDVDEQWPLDNDILGIAIERQEGALLLLERGKPGHDRLKAEILEDAYFHVLHRYERYIREAGLSREDALKALRDEVRDVLKTHKGTTS